MPTPNNDIETDFHIAANRMYYLYAVHNLWALKCFIERDVGRTHSRFLLGIVCIQHCMYIYI